ncbi:hypothetical protein M413DRAFT_438730 [Hebeloma cylindrosporum]|uniref:F-box domain-containing protein n=1 Tax=Hebeloma cylindrosporum TaxID=76867 RepID=A0A0C3CLG1_HEBCY|nr:hypothetical protein M413DRAFT_438730 [Hebeloma cylindrosporum h7]
MSTNPTLSTVTNTFTQLGDRKRKACDQESAGDYERPRPKKARLKPGVLCGILGLPRDAIYEIFSHLDPPDLINLSRTSKLLRKELLDPDITSVWKSSISNIPGLPERPDDLSYPRYAELVFGKACHFCGKQHAGVATSWTARVRACKACADVKFHAVSCDDRPYSKELFSLLPTAPGYKYLGHPEGPDRLKVLMTAALALNQEFRDLEVSARGQWEADKIKEWRAIHAHADRCENWVSEVRNLRRAEKKRVIEARQELVVERVKALGWGEELALIQFTNRRPENLAVVRKACNRILTAQALSNLEQPLTQHMVEVRKRRLFTERMSFLSNRLRLLRDFYTSHMAPGVMYPTTGDFFRIPGVGKLIDSVPSTGPFTQGHLKPILDPYTFRHFMLWWKQDIEVKLRDLISSKRGSGSATDLNLATSLFSCSECSRFLRHPDILTHACASLPFYQEDADFDARIVTLVLQESFWNSNGCIDAVDQSSFSLLIHLLSLANLDWEKATIEDLNKSLFECIPCNDERLGRATMTWDRAMLHYLSPNEPHKHLADSDFYSSVVILDQLETLIIRARMNEERERKLCKDSSQGQMVCLRCMMVEKDFFTLQKHVRTIHQVARPRIGRGLDILVMEDTPPIYRRWPPRTEDGLLSFPVNVTGFWAPLMGHMSNYHL